MSNYDLPDARKDMAEKSEYLLKKSQLGERQKKPIWALIGSRSHRIARAIYWLKNNLARPFRVNDLASQANMSKATFHHHFRTLTAVSPLQYQKRLRLNEARRLMLAERLDAATAALQVGYESASQFSREYSRLFGSPPLRDIMSLRQRTSHQRT
jgi:transcriptional regulator GlxA family with amidase domain